MAPTVEAASSKKKKSKKSHTKDKKPKADKKASSTKPSSSSPEPTAQDIPMTEDEDSTPLFTIDVNPTKVDPDAVKTEELPPSRNKKDKNNKEGEGPNREARRRLQGIEKRRMQIKKSLGIEADSDERADEVEKLLTAWTQNQDTKTATRKHKKEMRRQGKLNAAKVRKQKAMKAQGERPARK